MMRKELLCHDCQRLHDRLEATAETMDNCLRRRHHLITIRSYRVEQVGGDYTAYLLIHYHEPGDEDHLYTKTFSSEPEAWQYIRSKIELCTGAFA